jgi:hypothetical protein
MTRLSPRSIETLIDLVEIKLSCLDVQDREDREELKVLQRSLAELQEFRRSASLVHPQARNRTPSPALVSP